MSIAVLIKAAEGLVLAADSRMLVRSRTSDGREAADEFENTPKIFPIRTPIGDVAAAAIGRTMIGNRTARNMIGEFEARLALEEELTVAQVARKMSDFFRAKFAEYKEKKGEDMVFFLGGFDPGAPFGEAYEFAIPSKPKPVAKHPGEFGMMWAGDRDLIARMVLGYDGRLVDKAIGSLKLSPMQAKTMTQSFGKLSLIMPFDAIPIQDCVELAVFLVHATIQMQRWNVGQRTCGGPIDVIAVTPREGVQVLKEKKLTAGPLAG